MTYRSNHLRTSSAAHLYRLGTSLAHSCSRAAGPTNRHLRLETCLTWFCKTGCLFSAFQIQKARAVFHMDNWIWVY